MLKSRAIAPNRASSRSARGTAVITCSQHPSSAALGALAAAVVLASAPGRAFAEPTEPSSSPAPSSTVTSISFARVDSRVTEKLRERDDNLEWKCKGISMYDCSGELQEAAEQRQAEMGKMFRSLVGGPATPDTAESP
ncbi:hypothetical protein HYH02_009483 [Chlamydomonas schloesseri]|uniref:Uncharacterized protein n=1 Tax=Chlamydomonas schloesseri TaxID=2026947 RepID=A0A835W9E8_9CHLO|nr:hypothetical protein HYH02_009483 [Chlamydomonas schloesseri]|eukprot:KAG2443068.1 hypothetical protein HYH02_009483 [Chlamydomonas schloesseri]